MVIFWIQDTLKALGGQGSRCAMSGPFNKKKLLRSICSLARQLKTYGPSFKACVCQTPQEKLSCLGSHDKGEKSVHKYEGG